MSALVLLFGLQDDPRLAELFRQYRERGLAARVGVSTFTCERTYPNDRPSKVTTGKLVFRNEEDGRRSVRIEGPAEGRDVEERTALEIWRDGLDERLRSEFRVTLRDEAAERLPDGIAGVAGETQPPVKARLLIPRKGRVAVAAVEPEGEALVLTLVPKDERYGKTLRSITLVLNRESLDIERTVVEGAHVTAAYMLGPLEEPEGE